MSELPKAAQERSMNCHAFPPGWDEDRVNRLLAHYDEVSEVQLTAEDEWAAQEQPGQAVITVPEDLLPAIRQLLASREAH